MHEECFFKFEDHALTSLQKTGRARNWTNAQATANLWTKKGYDVVIKSCGCACDAGFIRQPYPMYCHIVCTSFTRDLSPHLRIQQSVSNSVKSVTMSNR